MNFVGGEPLMRPDIAEIIGSVDKDMVVTTLFTNGWLLSDRAKELKKAGLDGIYVSIDAADAASHDAKRGKDGLFEKALEGIAVAKKLGFSVGISCCIDKEAYEDGELDRIIELAKSKQVHEVVVFDLMPAGRCSDRDDLRTHATWVEDMIAHVKKYNTDDTYPGILIYAYTTSHRGVGCSGGMSYFYITPYGEICPCDFYHARFGNVRDEPLYKIWDRMSTNVEFSKAKWGGCRVKEMKADGTATDACNSCALNN
jgi:radical SAM protein with 4Fe4S-binding SPASM domain